MFTIQTYIKTCNVWHCDDCHRVGFYFDLTDAEIRDIHMKECKGEEQLDNNKVPQAPEVQSNPVSESQLP